MWRLFLFTGCCCNRWGPFHLLLKKQTYPVNPVTVLYWFVLFTLFTIYLLYMLNFMLQAHPASNPGQPSWNSRASVLLSPPRSVLNPVLFAFAFTAILDNLKMWYVWISALKCLKTTIFYIICWTVYLHYSKCFQTHKLTPGSCVFPPLAVCFISSFGNKSKQGSQQRRLSTILITLSIKSFAWVKASFYQYLVFFYNQVFTCAS